MSEQQGEYRILGSDMSPYSVKVRSWFRHKGIPHRWEMRGADNEEEFRARARLPLVPLVITPEDENLQDSTPLLEKLEQRHPEPSILPPDAGMRFLAALLEEFADEWGNKWLFHYRWAREVDQRSAAERLAERLAAPAEPPPQLAEAIRERMVPRLSFVGSSAETAPIIEASWTEALQLLQAHLQSRPCLLGQRPSMADFGLGGQLYGCSTDPTAGEMLAEYPALSGWVEKMLDAPQPAEGDGWETWESLAGTLFPLLQLQVGGLFLPWSDANARAIGSGSDSFEVELAGGQLWRQTPQKYHARSLAALRQKYAELPADSWCQGVLAEAGCEQWLKAAS